LSEAEPQGHDKTGRGRQYGLEVTRDLAGAAAGTRKAMLAKAMEAIAAKLS